MSFENILTSWLLSVDTTYKHELNRLRLNSLHGLHQVKISWEFLGAASTLWNSELHVFPFGGA